MGGLSNGPTPLHHKLRVEKSPFKFQPTGWRLTKMWREHILGYTGWLWSDEMNNRTALSKAPSEWMQIEHNMWGRREARSPSWWWPGSLEGAMPEHNGIKICSFLDTLSKTLNKDFATTKIPNKTFKAINQVTINQLTGNQDQILIWSLHNPTQSKLDPSTF